MNMREKIALALYVNLHEKNEGGAYVEIDPASMRSVRLDGDFNLEALADAALSILETPTLEMVEAGQRQQMSARAGPDSIFCAMIRAAKEG